MLGFTKSKYIIISIDGFEMPIVFHELITHVAMFEAIKVQVDDTSEVVGAGLWNVDARVAYGESTSLHIKSREEDTQILRQLLDPQ